MILNRLLIRLEHAEDRKLAETQALENVTAVILAGGRGTRLRPVIADRPKVLAEVGGRPFLAYLLDQLAATGVRDVVLCTGYLGEKIRATFGKSYNKILHLAYSQELSPLGTGGALRLALPYFNSRCVLVMNGDSFCKANLSVFWSWHYTKNANATLLLAKIADTKRYGRVEVNSEGVVLRFDEKLALQGSGWINAGIYLINYSLIAKIPTDHVVSLEHEVFPIWINRGLYGYRSDGEFLDIGTPESYAKAERFFALDPVP